MNENTTMFYNAKPQIFEKAKLLRDNQTEAERKVWEILKSKKILNLKFRPQHPIDIFITDFYCHKLKLIIEIDGDIHNSKERKEYDIDREYELDRWNIEVIRFTNGEVLNNIDNVKNTIERKCIQRAEFLQSPL